MATTNSLLRIIPNSGPTIPTKETVIGVINGTLRDPAVIRSVVDYLKGSENPDLFGAILVLERSGNKGNEHRELSLRYAANARAKGHFAITVRVLKELSIEEKDINKVYSEWASVDENRGLFAKDEADALRREKGISDNRLPALTDLRR